MRPYPLEEEKKKILVVDDEENLRLMAAFLIPLGYEVLFAHDGEEAIEAVRSYCPDLLLLDIMMPKMDGYEVARQLKADDKTKIIPIIMVTALTEVESRVKALEVGADDFLKQADRPNRITCTGRLSSQSKSLQ